MEIYSINCKRKFYLLLNKNELNKMKKLCTNLVNTYNTNVLNNAPIEIKKAFYNEAKKSSKNPECIRGRKVLKTLIENHFETDPEKQKPRPKFIGGPQTLTVHWSKIHQKMIYIFGEYHSKDMNCDERFGKKAKKEEWGSNKMSVEDFFFKLMLTTDVFIDFFFEFPSYSKKLNEYTTVKIANDPELRMQKLLDYFKKCVQHSTRFDTECILSRVHYFDIRRGDNKKGKIENTGLLDMLQAKLYTILNKSKNERDKRFKTFLEQNPVFRMIMNGLAETNDNIFLDFCMTFFINTNKFVVKELKKVDPEMQDLILTFIRKEFLEKTKSLRKMWQHNVPIILKHPYKKKAFNIALNSIFTNKIICSMCLVADTYALARMFKNFNMKDMQKAYTGAIDQPRNAHNIIIYTGDLHAQTYRKFLNSINFTQIARSGLSTFENITCLNMKTIPQPFFSVWPEE